MKWALFQIESFMMKRLLVIPARGGSQRIKENIKFSAVDLSLSIQLMPQKTSLFDEIHVSTEDDEVYKVCSANVQPKF